MTRRSSTTQSSRASCALPPAIHGVLVEDDRVRLVAGGALTDPRALEEALAVLVGVAHQLRRVGGANAPFR